MSSFAALVANGFREARRNRVTIVVAVFAGVLLLSSTFVADVAVATFHRVLVDVGLGTMSLILVFLAVFLSSGMVGREIERRTIFLVVSKPISRATFVLARLAGNMVTLLVLELLMAAIFFLSLTLFGTPYTVQQVVAIAMMGLELLVLSSAGLLMSTFSSQLVSGVVTVGLFFAGHFSADLYNLGSRAQVPALRWVAKAIYYLLPNLERFNYRQHATYQSELVVSQIFSSVAYGLAYSGVLVALAVMVFERRDFR